MTTTATTPNPKVLASHTSKDRRHVYGEVLSSDGHTIYHVAADLVRKTASCDCPARGECKHQRAVLQAETKKASRPRKSQPRDRRPVIRVSGSCYELHLPNQPLAVVADPDPFAELLDGFCEDLTPGDIEAMRLFDEATFATYEARRAYGVAW